VRLRPVKPESVGIFTCACAGCFSLRGLSYLFVRDNMANETHPLLWPAGWNRTPRHERRRSRFREGQYGEPLSMSKAINRVLVELRQIGVHPDDITVSTNSSGQFPEPSDPGAAVYWRDGSNSPRCMAIDMYSRVADNIAAIAATLNAMRAIKRHGGTGIMDRAFLGFKSLPAGPQPRPSSWREVLEFDDGEVVTRQMVQDRFRRLAKERHPDTGGNAQDFRRLIAARDAAMSELERGVPRDVGA
jgi:hypothetical protein